MHTATITIPAHTIEFDVDVWLEHSGLIGHAVSYWGTFTRLDGGIRIRLDETLYKGGPRYYNADWSRIANVIEALGRGKRLDLNGVEHDDFDDGYIIAAAHDFIHNPDEADGDTNVDDIIVQLSVFGELVFG